VPDLVQIIESLLNNLSKYIQHSDVFPKDAKGKRIIGFFKTCKARFSLREERIKSYKIYQVTQKEYIK
jgi:hypothetical protein